MYKIGVVGTSVIVKDSISAFLKTQKAQLTAIYSRRLETGLQFGKSFHCSCVETNFEQFLAREDMDIIYIASPNTFHYEQAKGALLAKKHVVVEKPAVVTWQQWCDLQNVAKENKVYLFEAIRHVYEPNFNRVTDFLKQQMIDGAVLNFGQYSRRMDDLKQGVVQNIFKPEMSAGVLMDLGVYTLHSALHWFGIPNESVYYPIKWQNGIDLQGDMILRYNGFNVVIHISKRTTSVMPSEVYCGQKTICIDSVDHVKTMKVYDKHGAKTMIDEHPKYRMKSQWDIFFNVLAGDRQAQLYYERVNQITGIVISMMEQLRKYNAIQFPADEW